MTSSTLKGVRVLDFSTVLAVPINGMYLAMMGAEVIKCESNQRLDFTRNMYPTDLKSGPNRGGLFQLSNVSKKSCTINLNTAKGLDLARELIKLSDVVMHNFSSRMIQKWGFDYETLKKLKPDLIVVSNSGFGRSGPEKDWFAYGRNLHASAGLAAHIGYRDGPPMGISLQWSDVVAALSLLVATLASIRHRNMTGEGQFIDVAMTEATVAMLVEPMMEYEMNGRLWECMGNRSDFMAPHGCYPCRGDDKWVAIAISSDDEWESFCHAIGNPTWTMESRFADALSRWENQDEIDTHVAEWTRKHAHYEATAILQKAGVAAGPVLDPQEIANDPHLNQQGLFVELGHPELGNRKGLGLPWKVGSDDQPYYRHAPLVGEDNHYVFCELLGMREGEFGTLVEDKVIW